MRRKIRQRREARVKGQKKARLHPGPADAATFLSVSGKLHGTRRIVPASDHELSVYQPVEVGKPLIIQYLRFVIATDQWESGDNELLISTFLKTSATKPIAAEAVTLYDPQTRPQDNRLVVEDWGGRRYGHPLIYYSPAYQGEPLSLSTQVLELDQLDKGLVDAMAALASGVSSMPLLTAFFPYAAAIGPAMGKLADLLVALHDFLNRDDLLVPYFDLDLYPPHAAGVRPLQCGRFVHVPSPAVDEATFRATYTLDSERNALLDGQGNEYGGPYLVFKVNSESHPSLKEFDALAGAAELLARVRPERGSLAGVVSATTEAAQATADLAYLGELLTFENALPDPTIGPRLRAMWAHLSPTAQAAFRERFMRVLAMHSTP